MTQTPLERLTNRPAPTGVYAIAHDPGMVDAIQRAEAVLRDAVYEAEQHPKSNVPKQAVKAAERGVKAAREALVTITIDLVGIGVQAVELLQAEHQPTEAQIAKAEAAPEELDSAGRPIDQTPAWNEDTYPPALIAASTVKVTYSDDTEHPIDGLSVENAAAFYAGLSQLDRGNLIGTIQMLNFRSSHVEPLGKG